MKTLLILALLLIIGTAKAAPLEKDLIGVWTLAEIQSRPNEELPSADIMGKDPKGIIIFDGYGHVSAHFSRSDTPKFQKNNRFQGSDEENAAALRGYIGYWGRYHVDGNDVLIYVEGSSFPNWSETIQRRSGFTVVGNEMRYIQPHPSVGGTPITLVWKRQKE